MMSESSDFFADAFATHPTMVILRGFDPDRTLDLCERADHLGISCIEVPVQSAEGLASLAAAVRWGKSRDCRIGAGTITSGALLDDVREAGAAFTVSPGSHPDVMAASVRLGLPHLPGVATATEIQSGLDAGFTWMKAFPAISLGTDWFAAMRGPFPIVRLVATGGVSSDNAREFLDAGAGAVSFGSAFEHTEPAAINELVSK